MRSILWRASLRQLLRHPWQTALSIAGVALGVAVAVAIALANGSAEKAFTLSTESLTGRATHQIVGGPGGVPEALYRKLVLDVGLERAAPVVEAFVTVEAPVTAEPTAETGSPRRSLHLLGIDPFAEGPFRLHVARQLGGSVLGGFFSRPGGVLLSAETARELGLEAGETFEIRTSGRRLEVELLAVLETRDERQRLALADLILADLATAQEVLDRTGRIDRIDLIVPSGDAGEAWMSRIRTVLPSEVQLLDAAQRTAATAGMTRAFRLNLTALSLLALICGTFLVYNTMSFSVVQRRPLLGRLRALGVTRGQLFRLVLGEAALIGGLGAAAGLALGIGLAQGLVALIAGTINDLYFALSVRQVALAPAPLLIGALAGLGTSLLAALGPAMEATSAPPRQVLLRSSLEHSYRRALPRLLLSGSVLVALGAAILGLMESLYASFLGLFVAILGAALLTPPATVGLLKLSAAPISRIFGLLGRMAVRGLEASLSRTAVAIAALTLAVSVAVGVGTMIDSFRLTVVRWLSSSLVADLYVSPAVLRAGAGAALLPRRLASAVSAIEGVAGVNTVRVLQLPGQDGPTRVVALDLRGSDGRRREGFSLKEGSAETAWTRFEEGAVLVSEPYAFHNDVTVGSGVRLATQSGERSFPVAGVYYDYGADRGSVLISRATYDRFWQDESITGIAVFAAPGSDPEQLLAQVRRAVGDREDVVVRPNGELRRLSLEIFDRTFRVTSVLHLLAGTVAFLGVFSALMALQMEKSRELAVLRAGGLTPSQLWRLVTGQTSLMGLVAGFLSIPLGLSLAAVMIFVINRRSFGWTLEMVISPAIFIEAIALAWVAAALAGLYPARKMARTPPAQALRGG